MELTALVVDQPYPLPVATTEGAAANFFIDGQNMLQVCMPDLQRDEIRSYRKDPMRAGLLIEGPVILLLFEFGKPGYAALLDCPFDSKKIPPERFTAPDIANDRQRLVIDIHLVDTAAGLLRGFRSVTLAPKTTRDLLSAVMDQRSARYEPAEYDRHLQMLMTQPLDALARRCEMLRCG